MARKPRHHRTHYITARNYKIIFDRLELETLRVDIEAVKIEVLYHGRWREPHIHFDREGYQFVDVYLTFGKGAKKQSLRKKCSIHRIMWMVANGEEKIPRGPRGELMDVSHEDHDKQHNHWRNLELRPSKKNRVNGSSFGSNGHATYEDEDF